MTVPARGEASEDGKPAGRLAGKVALVTGAARRVGRAIARTLAEEGASIAVHYRGSQAQAMEACEEFTGLGVQAWPVCADLADAGQAAGLVDRVVQAMGRIDVCVPSASAYPRTPLAQAGVAVWDEVMDLNLRSVYLVSRAAGLVMRDADGGAIVTLGDWAGLRPYPDYTPYCVSKAGVIALTKALARELAPEVRVNCVCPGPVLLPEDFDARQAESVRREVPLGRVGKPQDVAEAVRFLVCGTDYATGVILNIDGGRLIA